jgi:hypothetical protein
LRRVAALAAFAAAGWCLSWVGGTASRWQAANQPAFQADTLESAAGQGLLLGIFGGYRSIMADFAWVRAYVLWERRERAACETHMRLAIALDPGNDYFWRHTAHTIAFDMPHWETSERRRGGTLKLDPVVERQIAREYGERGLALYARAAARHPAQQADFWKASAQVCLLRLREPARGAEFYRRAAECENPLWYAAIAYVNVLTSELDMRREAAAWLRTHIARIRRGEVKDETRVLPELEKLLRKLERTATGKTAAAAEKTAPGTSEKTVPPGSPPAAERTTPATAPATAAAVLTTTAQGN